MLLAARSSGLGLLEAAWGCEEWLHVVVQWFPSSCFSDKTSPFLSTESPPLACGQDQRGDV